ncbi:hypothetical protein CDAR_58961 [Caerostris darwini]|uniref:Uncharacterized protein n=1 Tax=Caerostris darwini TaxID=1538125 RepID=A0AAV4X3G0_9ARAC|nr:hypothetical protein CDAR_58961 [Caerostris darwini]
MEITELPFPVTVKGSAIQGWSVLRRVLRYCGPLVRGYDKNGWWKGTLLWFCGEGVGRDCHCFEGLVFPEKYCFKFSMEMTWKFLSFPLFYLINYLKVFRAKYFWR